MNCKYFVRLLSLALALPGSSGLAYASDSSDEYCTLLVRTFNEAFEDESDVLRLPITFDAHIAIRAEVERVEHGLCEFGEGQRLMFLLHSPTRTLGGYWFHDKRFLVTLSPSDFEETGRHWDLAGIDWPMDNPGPYDKNLVCTGQQITVRTLVGSPEKQMFGPFSVFNGANLFISLDSLEAMRSQQTKGVGELTLQYGGDDHGRYFKPEFTFEALAGTGVLRVGSERFDLSCVWPSGDEE